MNRLALRRCFCGSSVRIMFLRCARGFRSPLLSCIVPLFRETSLAWFCRLLLGERLLVPMLPLPKCSTSVRSPHLLPLSFLGLRTYQWQEMDWETIRPCEFTTGNTGFFRVEHRSWRNVFLSQLFIDSNCSGFVSFCLQLRRMRRGKMRAGNTLPILLEKRIMAWYYTFFF